MAETFTVETRGIGKPDYTREVSSGRERSGITLKYNQQLVVFGLCWTDMIVHPSPIPWVKSRLPANGTHTAAVNLTVMTDAAANFQANGLVGMTIHNVTDGSSGVIIANTVNTITVAALTGGTTNRWNTNDVYRIIAHLFDFSTGLAMPYATVAGYTITMVQKDWTCNEDIEIWLYFDGYLVACPGISPSGDNVYTNPVYTYTSLTMDPTAALPHTWDVIVVNTGAGDMEGGIVVATIIELFGTPPFPVTKQCCCPFCSHLQTVKVGTTVIVCEKCGKKFIVQDFTKIREI